MFKKRTLFIFFILLITAFSCSKAKGEIVFYLPDYDGALTRRYADAIEKDFEKEYPRADLQIKLVTWGELKSDIDTALFSSNPPELSVVGTRWILEYLDFDFIANLNEFMYDETYSAFLDDIMNIYEGRIDGNLYGLPITAGARIMAVNSDLTSVVPDSMESLYKAALDVKRSYGKAGIVFPGKQHQELTDFVYYFYAAGGDFFEIDQDGSYGRCLINSDAGLKALKFMRKLCCEGQLFQDNFRKMGRDDEKERDSVVQVGAQKVFANGKAGYCFAGAWIDSMVGNNFNVKYSQIPGFRGVNNPSSILISDSIVMFKDSDNKESAATFLDWFFKSKWKLQFDKLTGFPPVTKEASKDSMFKTPFYETLAKAAGQSKGWPMVLEWEDVTDEIWNAIVDCLEPGADIETILDDTAEVIDIIRGYY